MVPNEVLLNDARFLEYISVMLHGYRIPVVLLALSCFNCVGQDAAPQPRSSSELKKIILHSEKIGAHGRSYTVQSMEELSRTIRRADLPGLIKLLDEPGEHIGTQVALASQCGPAIQPVIEAAKKNHNIAYDDAPDIMEYISRFNGCPPPAQEKARAAKVEVQRIIEEQQAQSLLESKKREEEDARIQRNGLKMLDPEQKKSLTRAEREEVFKRSVKAAGLENPQTPEQKDLYNRMYKTMVLD